MEDLKEHVRCLRLASKISMCNSVQPSDVVQLAADVHLSTSALTLLWAVIYHRLEKIMLCRSLVGKSHGRLALAVDQSCTN